MTALGPSFPRGELYAPAMSDGYPPHRGTAPARPRRNAHLFGPPSRALRPALQCNRRRLATAETESPTEHRRLPRHGELAESCPSAARVFSRRPSAKSSPDVRRPLPRYPLPERMSVAAESWVLVSSLPSSRVFLVRPRSTKPSTPGASFVDNLLPRNPAAPH